MHSELISALPVAEKHNQLLMKNYNARLVGSQAVPEAHAIIHRNDNRRGRGRGRGRGQGNTSWSHRGGRGRGNHNIDGVQGHERGMKNVKPPPQKPSSTQQTINKRKFVIGVDVMAIGLAHAAHLNTWLRHIKECRRKKRGRLLKVNHIMLVFVKQT